MCVGICVGVRVCVRKRRALRDGAVDPLTQDRGLYLVAASSQTFGGVCVTSSHFRRPSKYISVLFFFARIIIF